MARDKPGAEEPDRVGVFGGTFDPVHHGHLITAQSATEQLDLDHLFLVPTFDPPHRNQPEASYEKRLRMVRLGVEDHPRLAVSDVEQSLETPSYSIRTIETLDERHPDQSLVFLLGADELIEFTQWHRWEDILSLSTVVGMRRPGFDSEETPEEVARRVELIDVPAVDVSSTEFRRRRRNDRPIHYLVPESVRNTIERDELYRE
jgi:nicotinate-nucleotide adenylyltransferase